MACEKPARRGWSHARTEHAALAGLSGDEETTRERELREAHRLFTEMGASVRVAQVAKELDR